MYWLILITLCGISFSPFLFRNLDLWHAQGLWVQVSILCLFSYSFFENPKTVLVKNRPLGLMHFWVGSLTAYICFVHLQQGKYNIQNFYPYFNFLCLIVFYRLIVQYLSLVQIKKILGYLRYVVILTLVVCGLQQLNLSQFFKLTTDHHTLNNLVTGFIGNGTHLSGFLGMCVPLFLIGKRRENVLTLILMALILCFAGTTKGEPSISGFIIGFIILSAYWIKRDKRTIIYLVLLVVVMLPIVFGYREKLFAFNGRIGMWVYYWGAFINNSPVTGLGLGKINQVYEMTPFQGARHLHLEYFHFLLETGIIGFVLIINMIKGFFNSKSRGETQFILKLIVLGFCLSCLFNFPAHLWLPSTIVMFCYASFYAIKNEELINDKQP